MFISETKHVQGVEIAGLSPRTVPASRGDPAWSFDGLSAGIHSVERRINEEGFSINYISWLHVM